MSYTPILYPQLRDLLDQGTQLVEVLPAEEYAELHLPGSISIPLKTLDANTTAGLDRGRAVVVYCWDALCDLSPRAACRLATLGFEHVYDYMPSKIDWMARGLPLEGTKATEPRAIDFAHHDVVTCGLNERVGDVARQVADSPYGFAVVLSETGVLLGRLRKSALTADPQARAEELMEAGPSTVRADTSPGELAEKLRTANLTTAVITDPDGRLLGITRLHDLHPRAPIDGGTALS
jgi:rhodanese-related sulfurtransferase/CBS domain-containing protein